jgi:hypothetical protein
MADSESPEQLPSVDALQFRRAQPIVPESQTCASCKQPIAGEHYQVQNHVICPQCAERIRAGQQSQQSISLFRPFIYGAGAALAGCLLYAIPLAMGVQIGIVALAVGWLVGKAIRHASYGIGGRPQQILAVALTYFAISTSFFPATLFVVAKLNLEGKHQGAEVAPRAKMGTIPSKEIPTLLLLAAISPFLELKTSPAGGLISLFILFIGLRYAWALTARHEIIVSGPYS